MRSRTSEHSPGRPPDQSPPRTSVDGCRRRAQRHPATPETLRPVAPLPPAPAATARSLASALPMRVDAPDPPMGRSPRVSSSSGISRGGGVPGTPDACITPPPAPLPRALTLKGGFTVLDPQQRRLDRQARAQGYSDPHSYLLARAQQHASPAQLARELGTTTTAACRLLDTAGVTNPIAPPGERRPHAAHQHRPAAHDESGEAGLRLAPGLPDRPGDGPAMAQHQHRQRAWRAPRHRARPAQPARPAPPSGDRPALPGDPAAAGLLGGQAAGAPGGAGVSQRGGLLAGAGRAGLVAAAHAGRAAGGFRLAEGPDASALHPLTVYGLGAGRLVQLALVRWRHRALVMWSAGTSQAPTGC